MFKWLLISEEEDDEKKTSRHGLIEFLRHLKSFNLLKSSH